MEVCSCIVILGDEPGELTAVIAGKLDDSIQAIDLNGNALSGNALAGNAPASGQLALTGYSIRLAIVRPGTTSESTLELLGQLQKANPSCWVICCIPKTVVGYATTRINGCFLYIQAPIKAELLRLLAERPLAPAIGSQAFKGTLYAGTILQLIQFYLFMEISGRLIVWSTWLQGEVWVRQGLLVHANLGDHQGAAALTLMKQWDRGTFRFQPGQPGVQSMQLGPYDQIFLQRSVDDSSFISELLAAELLEEPAQNTMEHTAMSHSLLGTAMDTSRYDDHATSIDQVTVIDADHQPSWRSPIAIDFSHQDPGEEHMAVSSSAIKEILAKLELSIDGYIGAAVADSDSGMCLGFNGGAGIMNVEVAAAGNTEVVRAKRKAMKTLNLRDDIEDILITLGKHYHLIRPLRNRANIFIYVAVDRVRANLAMTRYALSEAERDLSA